MILCGGTCCHVSDWTSLEKQLHRKLQTGNSLWNCTFVISIEEEGNVFRSVCMSVSRVTEKVVDGFWWSCLDRKCKTSGLYCILENHGFLPDFRLFLDGFRWNYLVDSLWDTEKLFNRWKWSEIVVHIRGPDDQITVLRVPLLLAEVWTLPNALLVLGMIEYKLAFACFCTFQFMMMSPLTFKEIFAATIEVCTISAY